MDVDCDRTSGTDWTQATDSAAANTVWIDDSRPTHWTVWPWRDWDGHHRDYKWHPDERVRRRRDNKDARCAHAREVRALWPSKPLPEILFDSLSRFPETCNPSRGQVNRFVHPGPSQAGPHAIGAWLGPQGPPQSGPGSFKEFFKIILAIMLLFHILLCMDHIPNTAAFTLSQGTNRGARLAHVLGSLRSEDYIYGGGECTTDPQVGIFVCNDGNQHGRPLFNGKLGDLKNWCTDYDGKILVRMRGKGLRSYQSTFDIKGF